MAAVQSNDRIRDAKVFLASRIAEESERDGVPLSEVERKMLYFSEKGWTIPDMFDVSETFDRHYDRRQFERRVIFLIRRVRSRLRHYHPAEYETWVESVQALKGQDHYLMKLISRAQPEGEVTRLVITALVVIGVMLIAVFLANRGQ